MHGFRIGTLVAVASGILPTMSAAVAAVGVAGLVGAEPAATEVITAVPVGASR